MPRIVSMKFPSFVRLFGSRRHQASSRKRGSRSRGPADRPRSVRLAVENLEERTLLSVLPPPQFTSHADISSFASVSDDQSQESNPSVAVDPSNPNIAVSVWTRRDPRFQGVRSITEGGFTTDGGLTWTPFGFFSNRIDPAQTANPFVFQDSTDASVAFDRNGFFYVLRSDHQPFSGDPTATRGTIVLDKFDINSGTPVQVDLVTDPNADPFGTENEKIIYQWSGADAALTPTLAVDTGVPSYLDSDGSTRTDPFSGNVYVAWSTSDATPFQNTPNNVFFNSIMLVTSSDGGVSFSTAKQIDDTSRVGSDRNVYPRISISQGRPATPGKPAIAPGTVNVVWDEFNLGKNATPPVDFIYYNSASGGRSIEAHGSTGPITDARDPGNSQPHISTPTDFFATVAAPTDPNFVVSDINVTVSLTHPQLQELSITLISPAGPNQRRVPLMLNQTTNGGQTINGQGATGANLGRLNGNNFGTTFDDNALRTLRGQAATAPFLGHFIPDGFLGAFDGLTAADVTGNWTLEIEDHRANNVGFLNAWQINITSGLTTKFSFSPIVTSTFVRGELPTNNFPNNGGPGGVKGIGPEPVIASDNTLDVLSPNQGRLYLAYVGRTHERIIPGNPQDNTDIYLLASDDGGLSWFNVHQTTFPETFPGATFTVPQVNDDLAERDGFSEAFYDSPTLAAQGRAQYMPSVATDPVTGTLVMSWYDARNDASRNRVATYLAFSIDGGATFSPQTFANEPLQPLDAITQQNVTLGPIPDNPDRNNDGTFGFGTHQGLAVYDGHVYPVWAGNLNGGDDSRLVQDILSGPATFATGPRVVSSTMGPVHGLTASNGTTTFQFNDQFAPDGTPLVDGFLVTFDRPVDVTTFDISDVTIRYRSPSTPASAPGTLINATSVTPLDGALAATQFLVRFNPQSAVGTYSYTIGPDIRDIFRSVKTVVTSLQTATLNSPASQSNLRVPPSGTGGSGIPSQDTTVSHITVSGIPAGQVVTDVNVRVNINHTFDFDLQIVLVAPDGTRIILSQNNGGSGHNYTNTVFDDQAQVPITFGTAPFTGTFRPEQALSSLTGKAPNGDWRLEITDEFAQDSGVLIDWSLILTTGTVTTAVQSGNLMDQNANAVNGEDPAITGIAPGDVYAAPTPTQVGTYNGTNFSSPFAPDTMPLIVPGPHVASTQVPLNPPSPDNAVLAAVTVEGPGVTIPAASGTTPGQVTSQITITDDYTIQSVVAQLDIGIANSQDLEVTLVTPGGVRITLFQNVGSGGPDFHNTVLDDAATQSIVNGTAPFSSRYQPQQPLGALNGKVVTGTYTLEIKNRGTTAGTLNRWSLTFRKDATVSAIDVTFDRDMDPSTFTTADILRVTGPAGPIGPASAFTITPNPTGSDPNGQFPRTYRIGIPTQRLSGTYTVTLSPDIRSRNGDPLDTNLNAGLDTLRGQTVAGPAAPSVAVTFSASDTPLALRDATPTSGGGSSPGVTVSDLTVPDDFVSAGMTVRLNITHPHDADLTAVLIGPDGTRVTLFSGVPATSSGAQADFRDTVFDDTANTPIQLGSPPFVGRFNPQLPLSAFKGKNVHGLWQLEITDNTVGNTGRLNSWSLTFQKPVLGTGLGEAVADQATVSFRIFNLDNSNPTALQNWTPVGPASIGPDVGTGAGRVTGLAVDPSDPSGNTVFVGGASGGIWKTTNFLTTDPLGPTYVPLTDFGPTFSINTGSIAVFPRNNDPKQTIVFVATGEGDSLGLASGVTGSPGVGFLRSMDGGASWDLLDSTVNVDGQGNILPINSPMRDHVFSRNGGTSALKLAIDPRLTPSGQVIIYAALFGNGSNSGAGGIWRSTDTGKTWQQMRAGQASDVILDPNSGQLDPVNNPTGNLQIVYAGFVGEGVFTSPNRGQVWNALPGGVGKPFFRDAEIAFPSIPIPVNNPPQNPQGAKGRIVLAKPDLTGDPAKDVLYQGWLWVAVVTPANRLDGVYLTKDFGQNWTQVRVPALLPINNIIRLIPSNDTSSARTVDINVPGDQGNYDLTITVDANNPNIAYVGGQAESTGAGFIRIDATGLSDPNAFFMANDRSDGGNLRNNTTDPVTLKRPTEGPATFGTPLILESRGTPVVNMIRDPANPFVSNTTFFGFNTSRIANSGAGATWTPMDVVSQPDPFFEVPELNVQGGADYHRVLSMKDPKTGLNRLIIANDHGVYTIVTDAAGHLVGSIGDADNRATAKGDVDLINGSRNGNLQVTQFYYGASQPSELAAQINTVRQGLFYGEAQDDGFPNSDPNVLQNGNLRWTPPGRGDGGGVATDQTGTGTVYEYNWPCCGGNVTDFFRVNGVGRTFGLIQRSDPAPAKVPDPQWPFTGVLNFAVNPVNGNQVIIGSAGTDFGVTTGGKVFGTTNQALVWSEIGNPSSFVDRNGQNPDGTTKIAFAFGAPAPGDTLDTPGKFFYAGSQGGRIFVTFVGGGNVPGQNAWIDISAGLDGSPVRAIVASPVRGSHEAYAVTVGGVFFMADSSAANATWQNISGNLFQITHNPFGTTLLTETQLRTLEAIQVDWRYAIPDDPGKVINPVPPLGPTHPILYVAGSGGVYRSLDKGQTWTVFPNVAVDSSLSEGGGLPNVKVTDLDLALGNVRPLDGTTDTANGPDVLLATTYGRGSFAIRLSPLVFPQSLHLDPNLPAPNGSDTGVSKTDRITSEVRPFIDGFSLRSTPGSAVRIDLIDLDDPNQPVIGSGFTDANGQFAVQVNAGVYPTDGSRDGVHHIGVRATDAAGTVGSAQTFTFTLNTAPVIIASTVGLSQTEPTTVQGVPPRAGSDSGVSPTDRITNVTQPVFVGQVQQLAPVTVVVRDITNPANPIVIGTTMTDANGNFKVATPAGIYVPGGSSDGTKTIEVRATNVAGASSVVTFQFTLDTVPPGGLSSLDLSGFTDTGTSNSDHITSSTTQTFIGRVQNPADAGSQVFILAQLLPNGVATIVGNGTVSSSGDFTVSTSIGVSGTYQITAELADVAGNLGGQSAPLNPPLVLILTPPAPATLRLDPSTDTGTVGDNRTASVPQLYRGTNQAGVTITIRDSSTSTIGPFDTSAAKFNQPQVVRSNGVTIATYVQRDATDFDLTWSLTDGVHVITVTSTDVAGNVSTSAPLQIVIDREALDADRKFIRQVYSIALGRPGSLNEWNSWEPLMSQPDGRRLIANGIERSREARTFLVTGWYRTYLGRTPQNGEEQGWVAALQAGAQEEQVVAAILASPEYINRTPSIPGVGGTPGPDSFVKAVYIQILGRQAAPSEVAFWANLVRTVGAQNVAYAIIVSRENRENVVRGYYANLLQRPAGSPSQSEVDGWVFSGLDFTTIRVAFEASPEFFALVSRLS
jgi:subtilisin-like proprotein convertase family protein